MSPVNIWSLYLEFSIFHFSIANDLLNGLYRATNCVLILFVTNKDLIKMSKLVFFGRDKIMIFGPGRFNHIGSSAPLFACFFLNRLVSERVMNRVLQDFSSLKGLQTGSKGQNKWRFGRRGYIDPVQIFHE